MKAVKAERTLLVLIAVCLAVLVFGVVNTFRERVVVAGDSAPDFSVTADNGRSVSLSNFGGKLLVLNFWASWCPPCIQEMPSLDQFQRQFASKVVVVLGVSVDQDGQAYRRLLDKAKVAFLTARDPDSRISSNYGTYKFPETYLINSKGQVVEKFIGPMQWTDPSIVSRVQSLL